jgi:hypothetical protein
MMDTEFKTWGSRILGYGTMYFEMNVPGFRNILLHT